MDGFEPEALPSPDVESGYLEASHVDPVLELASLVETQRAFEAYHKLIYLTLNEIGRRAIDLGDPD